MTARPLVAVAWAAVALVLAAAPAGAWQFPHPDNTPGAGTGTYAYAREELPDTNFVSANLTWNHGKGGISWVQDPVTETNGGPVSDAAAATQGVAGPMPDPLVFTSDPLPFALHLNVSKLLHFDLQIATTSATISAGYACQSVSRPPAVEVWAGDQLIAGAPEASAVRHGYPGPAEPLGYKTAYYRMPLETQFLPSGTVVKLVLIYIPTTEDAVNQDYAATPSSCPRQYGFGDDQRSPLLFPVYSPDEVYYRDPALAGSDPFGLSGSPGTMDMSGGSQQGGPRTAQAGLLGGLVGSGALVAGVARNGPRRRRGAVVLLVLFMLAGALSGCLGSGHGHALPDAQRPGGVATATIQAEGDVSLSGSAFGTVLGFAHDELRIPIGAAYVTVVETGSFAKTDSHGWFIIRDVRPGTHTVRVEREGYRALESSIAVATKSVTRLDAQLQPLHPLGSDARPHYHDYWGPAATLPLFDGDLGTRCGQEGSFNVCTPNAFIRFPAEAGPMAPNTVVPGTYDVEVTVTWNEAAMGVHRFGLSLVANNDHDSRNTTLYYPRVSGAPFHIQSSWEMDDAGHQLTSTWRLGIYVAAQDAQRATDPSALQQDTGTNTKPPSFHVKAILHKGVVPVEPEHPDPWAAGSPLQVQQLKVNTYVTWQARVGAEGCFGSACCPAADDPSGTWEASAWLDFGAPSKAVPQGTKSLDLSMTATRATSPHFDWVLLYRPANVPYATYLGLHDNALFKRGPAGQGDGITTKWHIPIDPVEADPVYAKVSSWGFVVVPSDLYAACQDSALGGVAQQATGSPISTAFAVVANRS